MMLRRNPHLCRSLLLCGLSFAILWAAGCNGDPFDKEPTDQLRQRASNELSTFNFQLAADMYHSLLARTPGGDPTRPEVLFGLAMSLQNVVPATAVNIEESRRTFEQLLSESPTCTFAPPATLLLGRIAEVSDYMDDPVDLEGARQWYEKVIAGWPGQPIADEAALRIGGTYIQQYDDRAAIEQGVRYLRDWLKDRPNNEMASVMWQYLGQTYELSLDNPGEALSAYLEADRIGLVNQTLAGRMWWHMTELAEKLGRTETAVTYYRKIVTEAPRSGRAWEAQQALRRISEAHPEMRIVIPELRSFMGDAAREMTDQPEQTP
ncbi:MAG: tetratricopeptide repeat protein [Phycisphaeraceae bacterium]